VKEAKTPPGKTEMCRKGIRREDKVGAFEILGMNGRERRGAKEARAGG